MTLNHRRKMLAPLLLTLAVGVSPAVHAYRLDSLLGRPMTSNLVVAESVNRLAWVENERGVRSLWTASGPEFTARLLWEAPGDDGQSLGGLQLTPDGSVLVYQRGSAPNAAGEIANPASDPGGVERSIWAVSTAGGEPWKVAAGGGAVLHPTGESLLYAMGGKVFEVAIRPEGEPGEKPAAPPETLFQARGQVNSLAYSSDGGRIAFASARGDHAFIGVYHREPARIVWLGPSVDRDSAPVWSPDDGRIAFVRSPGLRIGERFDLTRGYPFSIWIGDPESGSTSLLRASPGADGGFAHFYPPKSLEWGADGWLIFTSEEGGWHHAFGVHSDTGRVRDLTPGDAEIEAFTLSRDRSTVYFWGNHGDPDRRHVWSVAIDGGEPEAVTRGSGLEVEPVPLSDGSGIALRFSDASRPMAIGVLSTDATEIRRIAPALPEEFPAGELVTPQQVVFAAADGLEIHGQLFLPPGGETRRDRPAVIFMHGGPIRQMLLGWHYSGYYANAYAFNQYLASRGYVVLAVNFRSGIGYGRDFRQASEQGPRGASEYRDIVAAGRFLAEREDVDSGRIGLWGGSYGGLLTAMGLARDSDLFAAGVDLHGVHDWAFRGSDFPLPGGAWGLTDEDAELALESSPVADVEDWRSPVLLVHGDDDRNVMFIQSTDLVQRLREREVHVETLVFPDEVHGFLRYESWLRTFDAAFDFFERFLGGRDGTPLGR